MDGATFKGSPPRLFINIAGRLLGWSSEVVLLGAVGIRRNSLRLNQHNDGMRFSVFIASTD
jgi:hypothetical protein